MLETLLLSVGISMVVSPVVWWCCTIDHWRCLHTCSVSVGIALVCASLLLVFV